MVHVPPATSWQSHAQELVPHKLQDQLGLGWVDLCHPCGRDVFTNAVALLPALAGRLLILFFRRLLPALAAVLASARLLFLFHHRLAVRTATGMTPTCTRHGLSADESGQQDGEEWAHGEAAE